MELKEFVSEGYKPVIHGDLKVSIRSYSAGNTRTTSTQTYGYMMCNSLRRLEEESDVLEGEEDRPKRFSFITLLF